MPIGIGTYYPRRVNSWVPNLVCDVNVDKAGVSRIEFGKPIALNATGILNAFVTVAGVATPPASTFKPERDMGRYGRNLTATAVCTVRGRDYLGQPMTEDLPVGAGKKAFKSIDSITNAAGGATSVGWGNVLGLPYATLKLDAEIVDGVSAAAGTLVPLFTGVGTSTSADPRGTYTPAAGVIPNGARDITVVGYCLAGNLHGSPHFYA